MKSTIGKLVPEYNTARMVREYAKRFYVPSIKLSQKLTDGDLAGAKALTAWKDQVRAAWPGVSIREVRLESPDEVAVGDPVKVSAMVQLGALKPKDVAVELYHGPTSGGHEVVAGENRPDARGRSGGGRRVALLGRDPDRRERSPCVRGARNPLQRDHDPPARDVADSLGLSCAVGRGPAPSSGGDARRGFMARSRDGSDCHGRDGKLGGTRFRRPHP